MPVRPNSDYDRPVNDEYARFMEQFLRKHKLWTKFKREAAKHVGHVNARDVKMARASSRRALALALLAKKERAAKNRRARMVRRAIRKSRVYAGPWKLEEK